MPMMNNVIRVFIYECRDFYMNDVMYKMTKIVTVGFLKNPEKLCSGDGDKWTFLFLGIFGNTLKTLKLCSQFSKKYVKKHAVPKCII